MNRSPSEGGLSHSRPIGGIQQSSSITTPLRTQPETKGSFQLAELFYGGDEHKVRLAQQIGIKHAIVSLSAISSDLPRSEYGRAFAKVRDYFADAGMVLAGAESHPVPAERIKLGLPGRDEEIENYLEAIRVLAQLGVPLICYNWMAGLGWYRTRSNVSIRGGALVSEFDLRDSGEQELTEWGMVSEETIWRNLEYFLRAVMPVAEEVGMKMALHPDDPPLSPLRGIGRILTSADAFRRVLSLYPSPLNGITFCQANFRLMGEDIAALTAEWCAQKKIFFVHLRDIEGTKEHFRETFHDACPVDLAKMLSLYHECGFEGPIRPDHAPTLDGESNERPGYAMGGKIFAIGYIKGALDAFSIPYS